MDMIASGAVRHGCVLEQAFLSLGESLAPSALYVHNAGTFIGFSRRNDAAQLTP